MAIERAWVRITAGATPTIAGGRRASSVVRNGAGDYSVTFTDEFVANSTNYGILAGILGSDSDLEHIDAVAVDDDTVRVRTPANGVNEDADFCVEVISVST